MNTSPRVKCADMKAYMAAYRAKRKAQGICFMCKEPLSAERLAKNRSWCCECTSGYYKTREKVRRHEKELDVIASVR